MNYCSKALLAMSTRHDPNISYPMPRVVSEYRTPSGRASVRTIIIPGLTSSRVRMLRKSSIWLGILESQCSAEEQCVIWTVDLGNNRLWKGPGTLVAWLVLTGPGKGFEESVEIVASVVVDEHLEF
ncbi:hypothetical protein Acr_27g0006430 [Actinidia rufa]|uniref:Uncharacterized protein n=1 Tax=Actinidia rufa TaxID=165716 RepID=A0A7J0H809_9ERIC|nr:hypothetical protein Acr_27g0006430 [Actinidia rufa]